jgi:catechol 2,3-dioxygenase-like lactoylglutathione lyase family enzyme
MFLEHVNLSVSNLDRSLRFYRDLFGFDVRWRGSTVEGAPAAHLGDARHYLALFEAREAGKANRDYDRVGINHFGFVVDDLSTMKRRLHGLGVVPHFEADYEPGRRLYFFDPDGVEVELVEYDEDEKGAGA